MTRNTKEWLRIKHLTIWKWSSLSPDLHPTEHLWKEQKHAAWRRNPSHLRQLRADTCTSLTESYRNGLTAVLVSTGCATKYEVKITLRGPSFVSIHSLVCFFKSLKKIFFFLSFDSCWFSENGGGVSFFNGGVPTMSVLSCWLWNSLWHINTKTLFKWISVCFSLFTNMNSSLIKNVKLQTAIFNGWGLPWKLA